MADLQETLKQLKSDDMNERYRAWDAAGPLGAKAVAPLAELMKQDVTTIGKAGKMALQNVVNYAGRSGAEAEAKAVTVELMKVASSAYPRPIRGDALYWVGLIGGPDAIPGLVKLLNDRIIREDARTALERIPGEQSLAALKAAAASGATDFRKNIEQSIRNRGLTRETAGIADGAKRVS